MTTRGAEYGPVQVVNILAASDGLGLVGMRERATVVGGKIEYTSVPGKGTEVYASLGFHPALNCLGFPP